jgi:hypothetical protein
LEKRATAMIRERIELPRSLSSIPVIKVSARIRLKKKTILNRSIPPWKLQRAYVLTIAELYRVATNIWNSGQRNQ